MEAGSIPSSSCISDPEHFYPVSGSWWLVRAGNIWLMPWSRIVSNRQLSKSHSSGIRRRFLFRDDVKYLFNAASLVLGCWSGWYTTATIRLEKPRSKRLGLKKAHKASWLLLKKSCNIYHWIASLKVLRHPILGNFSTDQMAIELTKISK